MLRLRGKDTVKVSKVKGHATQAMVDNGDVRHEDFIGNSCASLLALWHDRRQRSFNTTTSWWRQPCKMIWDLRWHLSQCGSSVLVRKQQQLRDNWKQACTCVELCSDKHITLSTQIWINWPVSHKLMSETLRFPQSKRSSYCCTWSKDFSSLRSLPQSVEREYQHMAYANIQVHTAYTSIQVHTAYTSIQIHTATDALAVYATVLQFCQSLPTSFWRYNSSDLRVVHASSPEPWILATLKRRVFLFASEGD